MSSISRIFARPILGPGLGLGLALIGLGGIFGVSGCFLRPNTVIERFNGEFRCPKEQIKIERPDKNQPDFFRAIGCNRRANYRCTGDYGEFCERIGQPETVDPGSSEGATPTPNIGTPPPKNE